MNNIDRMIIKENLHAINSYIVVEEIKSKILEQHRKNIMLKILCKRLLGVRNVI